MRQEKGNEERNGSSRVDNEVQRDTTKDENARIQRNSHDVPLHCKNLKGQNGQAVGVEDGYEVCKKEKHHLQVIRKAPG